MVIEGGNVPDQRNPKAKVRIRARLNDHAVFEGPNDFPDSGFGQQTVVIKKEYFKSGTNAISISNLEPEGPDGPPYVAVDRLELQAAP